MASRPSRIPTPHHRQPGLARLPPLKHTHKVPRSLATASPFRLPYAITRAPGTAKGMNGATSLVIIHVISKSAARRRDASARLRVSLVELSGMASRPQLTSSNGRVSGQQLSHTSFTTRSASTFDLQFGLASTDRIARRRTHACGAGGVRSTPEDDDAGQRNGNKPTYLVLLREVPVPPGELAAEAAVAREVLGPDLAKARVASHDRQYQPFFDTPTSLSHRPPTPPH